MRRMSAARAGCCCHHTSRHSLPPTDTDIRTRGAVLVCPTNLSATQSTVLRRVLSSILINDIAILPSFPLRCIMSRPALRKQSLTTANASAVAHNSATPWDTQQRPCVPDFSTYLDQAESLCPHLTADLDPPSPPASATSSHSAAAQLLHLTRLQAELEERQLAAYRSQISDEYAALVSVESLDEQRTAQQLLLSHLHALTRDGAESSLAVHVRHVTCCPSAVLNGLTSVQQASVHKLFHHVRVPSSQHRLSARTHHCLRSYVLCQRHCVVDDSRVWRVGCAAFQRRLARIGRYAAAEHAPTLSQYSSSGITHRVVPVPLRTFTSHHDSPIPRVCCDRSVLWQRYGWVSSRTPHSCKR